MDQGLTPAQTYQASTGLLSAPSHAGSAYPNRTASSTHSNPSYTSIPSGSSSGSHERPSNSSHSTSRSPPPRPMEDSKDRFASPPPDYINALSALNFDGQGSGPLDSVSGIPRRGERSDFGNIADQWALSEVDENSGEFCYSLPWSALSTDRKARAPSISPYTARPVDNRRTSSSSAASGGHRRMASDSSLASSGFTISSMSQRTQMA
jgi:hypothetical protein